MFPTVLLFIINYLFILFYLATAGNHPQQSCKRILKSIIVWSLCIPLLVFKYFSSTTSKNSSLIKYNRPLTKSVIFCSPYILIALFLRRRLLLNHCLFNYTHNNERGTDTLPTYIMRMAMSAKLNITQKTILYRSISFILPSCQNIHKIHIVIKESYMIPYL